MVAAGHISLRFVNQTSRGNSSASRCAGVREQCPVEKRYLPGSQLQSKELNREIRMPTMSNAPCLM
ncbi:hypothetical protein DOTSEDRAFT_74605 [Dothistroma septosporum NZE10]|uniref:Uncharacterized protein n=1 Tax=Dothistroma septosporum (strain NZE10 / CBS 128990) TaxID=675120 RepID=N1PER3_DOTSN|nr:hypothetical protein DOTSEDRAFT_74605 [Dothistroma septosporum NZE10]